jgi:hypothetical protein
MEFNVEVKEDAKQKPKEIVINLCDLPSIVLSDDAISFSKLISAGEP